MELDSWIYPAIERLAALGYIHSEFLDMRPWTRIECATLVEEAEEAIQPQNSVPKEVEQLYSALQKEFQGDLDALTAGKQWSVRIESLYTNVTGINGAPLNDSRHFGQTIINNYGRP